MTDNVDNEANIAIWPAGESESAMVAECYKYLPKEDNVPLPECKCSDILQ